jgi:diaminohydroxyphosphoribosylaminopyrimidine deaminase/5-amino-6-(5-phosphoribosylamino)uracil reductase
LEAIAALESAGCECLRSPIDAAGKTDVRALLAELGRRRWTHLLLEGGAETLGAFVAADCVDAVRIYIAPLVIGGPTAPGPVGGAGVAALAQALRLGPLQCSRIAGDVFLQAFRVNPSPLAGEGGREAAG